MTAALGTPTTTTTGSTSTPAFNLPSFTSGRLGILVTQSRASRSVSADPSGWTVIADERAGTTGGPRVKIYARLVDGSEGATASMTLSGNSVCIGYVYEVTGADLSDGLNTAFPNTGGDLVVAGAGLGESSGTGATTLTNAGFTTTVADTLLVQILAQGGSTNVAFTPATGFGNEVEDYADDGTNDLNLSISYQAQASAGSTGSMDASSDNALPWANIVLGIAPDASGATDATAEPAAAAATAAVGTVTVSTATSATPAPDAAAAVGAVGTVALSTSSVAAATAVGAAAAVGAVTISGAQADTAFDDFSELTLGTADTGQTWTVLSGSFSGTGPGEMGTNGVAGENLAVIEVGTGDMAIETNLGLSAARANIGAAFYAADANNFMYVQLYKNSTTDRIDLVKRSAGTYTTLVSVNPAGLTLLGDYELTVRLSGKYVQVLANDHVVINHTLSLADQTEFTGNSKAGLRMYCSATNDDADSTWDDFRVSPIDAAVDTAVLVQGWTSTSVNAATSIARTLGSAPVSGNVLIAVVSANTSVTTIPDGFALLESESADVGLWVYTKDADGSETGSLTFGLSPAGAANLAVAEVSGIGNSLLATNRASRTSGSTAPWDLGDLNIDEVGAYAVALNANHGVAPTSSVWSAPLTEVVDRRTNTGSGTETSLAVATGSLLFTGPFNDFTDKVNTSVTGAALLLVFPSDTSSNNTVRPATVAAVGAVGAAVADVPVNATVAAAAVAAVGSVPAVVVGTSGITLIPVATVAATAAVGSFTVTDISITIVPDPVAAVAGVEIPAGVGDEDFTLVSPAVVAATAAVDAPTVSQGVSATVTPDVVAATADQELPAVSTGTAAAVAATVVAGVAEVLLPATTASAVVVFPNPVTAVAAVPAAAIDLGIATGPLTALVGGLWVPVYVLIGDEWVPSGAVLALA